MSDALFSPGAILRVAYGTTQRTSSSGRDSLRTVLILRSGFAHETEYGKDADMRPGWWLKQGSAEKFFFTERILSARVCSIREAKKFSDCPPEVQEMSSEPDRAASPESPHVESSGNGRSRSRSRSGSRSPLF